MQPYSATELQFAYSYRVYLRVRTHGVKPCRPLAALDRDVLISLVSQYDIHILESTGDATDLLVLVSLKPAETISSCASKLKGRVSKWLREALGSAAPIDLLSRGYFACTTGASSRTAVEEYLSKQSEHHGYEKRVVPPVYSESYVMSAQDELRITPKHAFVVSRFHLVMATRGRRGVFGSREGREVAAAWVRDQAQLRISLVKVSFVPDHVHIAVRAHPSVSPADVAAALMNRAQEVLESELISVGSDRLWQPSAYIGGYGDLASPQIRKYIENWAPNEQRT